MECKDCRQVMNNSDGCTYAYVAFVDKPEKSFEYEENIVLPSLLA